MSVGYLVFVGRRRRCAVASLTALRETIQFRLYLVGTVLSLIFAICFADVSFDAARSG